MTHTERKSGADEGNQMLAAWIKDALDKKAPEKTKAGLAKALGLNHQSAVTRILAGKRRLTSQEVELTAAYLEDPPPNLHNRSAKTSKTIMVNVVGKVYAGIWHEPNTVYADIDVYIPIIPDQRYAHLRHYGLRVEGPSVNKKIPHGYIAICVPYFEARRELTAGDLVVVERHQEHMVETTIKVIEKVDRRWVLRPCSTDPRYQKAINLNETFDRDITDGFLVKVTGLVVGAYMSLVAES